jgi:hypothetical protein
MNCAAFLCLRCGAEMTDFLRELPEDKIVWERGRQAVPAGCFVRVTRPWTYREFVTCGDPSTAYVADDGARIALASGDYLVNEVDVRHMMKPGAFFGCCGWQPRDEANIQCAKGHDVGTLHADECWAPRVLRLIAGTVEQVVVDPEVVSDS